MLAATCVLTASVALASPAPGSSAGAPAAPSAVRTAGAQTAGVSAAFASSGEVRAFDAVVAAIEAQPYNPEYLPQGLDRAFLPVHVRNDFPQEDYTTGSIPGSPDAPAWPAWFHEVLLRSPDGARFFGELALQPQARPAPAVLVVPGFNTHSDLSVIRWAAMLYTNGFDVLAADQRDYSAEYGAGYGYPKYPQTFGWKEAQDVLTAGEFLRAQRGVTAEGIVGFSEGGQNAVLAMADAQRLGLSHLFEAGLSFSGPADQNTQIYSTAEPKGCSTPACTYPVTDALVALVVPPYDYTNVCAALDYAAAYYHTTAFQILARESAFHAQSVIRAPLLNFFTADDPLVAPFEARMMAGYEGGHPLQRTVEITTGLHAYYFDRYWQQRAILLYFKALLPGATADRAVTTAPTVNMTPGGKPLADQLVGLGHPTPAQANAYLAPFICDTAQGSPGAASTPPPAAADGRGVQRSAAGSARTRPAGQTGAAAPPAALTGLPVRLAFTGVSAWLPLAAGFCLLVGGLLALGRRRLLPPSGAGGPAPGPGP